MNWPGYISCKIRKAKMSLNLNAHMYTVYAYTHTDVHIHVHVHKITCTCKQDVYMYMKGLPHLAESEERSGVIIEVVDVKHRLLRHGHVQMNFHYYGSTCACTCGSGSSGNSLCSVA